MLVKKIFSFQDICKISKHLYLAMGLDYLSQVSSSPNFSIFFSSLIYLEASCPQEHVVVEVVAHEILYLLSYFMSSRMIPTTPRKVEWWCS